MTLRTLEDTELVTQFRKGNNQAFEELVVRYTPKAHSLVRRLTRNQEDAEEVLQDVFVTVFRKIDGFEGKSSFSSWLYRITVNAALMKLRKRNRNQLVSIEEVVNQVKNVAATQFLYRSEGEAGAVRAEVAEALESAIDSLPDDYKPVFILRDVHGLTSKQVATILDITVPAVKSRLHRARLALREQLEPFYKEYIGRVADDIAA